MLQINRITSEQKPDVIEIIDIHNYRYNYNIVETTGLSHTNAEDEEPVVITMYEYTPILLKGYPNYADCVRAVLREYVSLEDEFKIINEYNESIAMNEDERDTEAIDNYKQYLQLRKEIKSIIKKDFNICK